MDNQNTNPTEVETPTVVTQETLDANPELAAAGVEVGTPIGEATPEQVATAEALENAAPETTVEPTETQPEPAVVEETPAPVETVEETVVEAAPIVEEEKKN